MARKYGVLKYGQQTGDAIHLWVKKARGKQLVRQQQCEQINETTLSENYPGAADSDSQRPSLVSRDKASTIHVESLDVVKRSYKESEGLLLQYPIADQSGFKKQNRRRIWGQKKKNT
jgi:hypothetical protein